MPLAWIRAHRHWLWPGIVLVVASVFFLYRYPERKLEKSDEALYAAGALELVNGQNPLYPRGEFSAYWVMGKPPGALWPSALLMAVFGPSKAAVRLPNEVAGIAAICFVFLIGSAIGRRREVGALAALFALTPKIWLEMARVIWLENMLTALFLAAVWLDARARALPASRRQLAWQCGVGALVGYAVLVKHAVGLAPLAALIVAELVCNPAIVARPRELLRRFGPTIGGALLVCGPWLIAFMANHGVTAPVAEIGKKLAQDPHVPRAANDVWKLFNTVVEPWYLFAGLACLMALLLHAPRRRHDEQPATQPDPTFLAVACSALFASHLLVFCTISDKLRDWYMLPVIPLLGLAIGTVVGGAAARTLPRLGALALVVVVSGLSLALNASLAWYTTAALVLGALCLAIGLRRALPRLPRWPSTAVALTAVLALLGIGLVRSGQHIWREYPVDNFAYFSAQWRQQPPAQLYIDEASWRRPIYMTPSVYFYFSPVPIVPHSVEMPCDLSDIAAGDHLMLHINKYQCVAARAAEARELGPWWRMVRLR